MKKQKILALILAVFMLTTLIIPVCATGEVKPVAGYDASLVAEVDLSEVDDIKYYSTLQTKGATRINTFKITDMDGFKVFCELMEKQTTILSYTSKDSGKFEPVWVDPEATEPVQATVDVLVFGHANYKGEGITIYLTTDLDFQGEEIAPIGGWKLYSTDYPWCCGFSGTFDALGHTIDNFKITAPTTWTNSTVEAQEGLIGLFRSLTYGAEVRNLIIGGKAIVSSRNIKVGGIGALTGRVISAPKSQDVTNANPVMIYNVCNNATVLTNGAVGGGLIGRVSHTKLEMDHCTNNGTVKPAENATNSAALGGVGVGGLIGILGENCGTGKTSCYCNKSTITTVVNVTNSVNSGKINGGQGCTGGIVGYRRGRGTGANDPLATLTIDNCVNLGEISNGHASYGAGGILGQDCANKGSTTITNCTNYGVTTATKNGGIVGTTGGNVTADNTNKNCAFNDNMVVSHYQTSAAAYTVTGQTGNFYSVRVISMHDNLSAYTSFGYKVTVTYGDNVTKTLKNPLTDTTVYTSLTVDGKTVTPDEYGYGYFSAISIDNIPVANGDITVTVTPIITYVGQSTPVEGVPVTFTVAASTLYAD